MSIDHTFVPIPHAVLYDKRLSMGAKVAYSLLYARCCGKNYCLLGRERLAEELGTNLRTVKRYVAELRGFGLIETHRRMGTSSVTKFSEIDDLYDEPTRAWTSEPFVVGAGSGTTAGAPVAPRGDTNGPAKEGTKDPPKGTPPAREGEEGRKEKERGGNLIDELLGGDPLILQAAEIEVAQEAKAKKAAEKRLRLPPTTPIPRDQSDITSKEVPGNINSWTNTEWANRFKRAAETQGLQISSYNMTGIIQGVTKVRTMMEERAFRPQAIYEIIFRWLIPNWETISEQVFKNHNAGDHRIMTLGLITSKLPAILALRSSSGDRNAEAAALKRLGAKKITL